MADASSKVTVIDLANMTHEEIVHAVNGLRLKPGRALGKPDKTDLGHEAVWEITCSNGRPVIVITGPVLKKFAVNMLYQGSPVAKLKVDFVVDKALPGGDKTRTGLELIQDRLFELTKEVIPAESTNPFWKNKPNNVEENFPKLIKPGKKFRTKEGEEGQYDPSFTVGIRTPTDQVLNADTEQGKLMRARIAAYKPPAADKISKGFNDNLEAYVAALCARPPPEWEFKTKNAEGVTVSNDVLLEKRNMVVQVMYELNSMMIKPVKTLSGQLRLRQIMLCDVAGNNGRVDDDDLDALWVAPKAVPAIPAAVEEDDY